MGSSVCVLGLSALVAVAPGSSAPPRGNGPPAGRQPAKVDSTHRPSAPASSSGTELPRAEDTVLVLELRPVGITAPEAHIVTVQVAELTAQRTGRRVLTSAEVDELVQHQKTLALADCDSETCITELSRAANARHVLTGSVGAVGGAFVVSLNLVDVARAAPAGGGTRSMPTLEALVAALPALVAEIFPGAEAPRPRFALPTGKRLSMAVLDLKPLGITKETADNLTQVLAAELKQIQGARVVSRDDIVSMLEMEAQKDRLGCEGEAGCLTEIGGALGVDDLVVGHVGKLGDSFVVSLRLIAVRTVSVENRVTETFAGQEDQLLRAVRTAGRVLLGLEVKTPGVLAISASEPATDVFINEDKVGVMPMPPVADLSPGRHRLRLSKSGFLDWVSDVYVEPAATSAVWAQMLETPPRWYQRWWVWTVVGAVAVGGGVAAIYASQAGSKSSTVNVHLR